MFISLLELQATLEILSNLLGPPFQPPQPLQPIASSSKCVLPTVFTRSSLGRIGSDAVPSDRSRRSVSSGILAQSEEEGKKEIWKDVGEEVMETLEIAVQKAMDERVRMDPDNSSWICWLIGLSIVSSLGYSTCLTYSATFSSYMPSSSWLLSR